MAKADLASLALSVEVLELGIHAGLMDRVAQVSGGLVAMDFSKDVMEAETGQATLEFGKQNPGEVAMQRGRYERLPLSVLPSKGSGLLLAYARDPSDSEKIHANVKERWVNGDMEVLEAAKSWAGFVDEALEVLRTQPSSPAPSQYLPERFCQLVDENLNLRFKVYGEQCLGWKNIRMIEIARAHSASGKFCGSGGAIVVLPRPTTDVRALQEAMGAEGFVLVKLLPTE
jgi:galactokinase/mevalonate kinase-like predicted kinase